MPPNRQDKRLDLLEVSSKQYLEYLAAMRVDILWLKRIIVAAAGLGLVEKLFGWFFKLH